MGFPSQEYWSGLRFPPPGDLPDPWIKPTSPTSPALAGMFFSAIPSPGKPQYPLPLPSNHLYCFSCVSFQIFLYQSINSCRDFFFLQNYSLFHCVSVPYGISSVPYWWIFRISFFCCWKQYCSEYAYMCVTYIHCRRNFSDCWVKDYTHSCDSDKHWQISLPRKFTFTPCCINIPVSSKSLSTQHVISLWKFCKDNRWNMCQHLNCTIFIIHNIFWPNIIKSLLQLLFWKHSLFFSLVLIIFSY